MKSFNSIIATFIIAVIISCDCKEPDKKPISDFSNKLTPEEIAEGKMTAKLLWKFGRIGETVLSPDGKTVLYTVKRYDLNTNAANTDLFSVSTENNIVTQLTDQIGYEGNPRWIDNGKKIAFLTGGQIWTMNLDGTGKKQISSFKEGINEFDFSPSEKLVFYSQDVKLDKDPHDLYPDLPLAEVRIETDLMYVHWDNWHDYMYSHLFISEVNNNKISEGINIMKDERWDHGSVNWSPDNKILAYSCKKLSGKEFAMSTNTDIYLYNLESKKTVNITEEMPGYDRSPVFSPDGKKIAFRSMEEAGYESDRERLFIYDMVTKQKKELTSNFDQDATSYNWKEDGSAIYFISGIKATYQVYSIDIKTNEIKQITNGDHDYNSLAYANETLVGKKTKIKMAVEIFKVNPENGEETQLSFVNKNIYDNIKMGEVKERWIKTTDNKDMLLWIVYPPDFDPAKKYPILLMCTGGPHGAVSQGWSYRWNYQLMAAHGYIVTLVNRRGLPSFGEEWNDQICGDYGGQNMKDYISAVENISKEPYTDENNVGAVGASYGGFAVYYLAGNYPDHFDAFISHCGMYNFESWYATTEEMFFPNKDIEGAFWEDPKPNSYKFSPHLFIKNWNTPILITTGARDYRIPYTQSLEAYNAAQLLGVPSKLLYFPDETHFVLQPQNAIIWQTEFFTWLDKWLKD